MAITPEIRKAFESFLLSKDLFTLESRFAKFNVFEALGVERKEIHHSNFLAYLLEPSESHGLRGLFLQKFLQEAVREYSNTTISVMKLDGLDLSQMTVRREYENIDLYLTDSRNKLVVVIENKVGSKQHDNQLTRYRETADAEHRDFRFLGIYLTEDGQDPKDEHYAVISYKQVRKIIEDLLNRENVFLSPAFRSVLVQYADLLKRRFMEDTELTELCASIYKEHKQAIDILRKNLPDSLGIALETVKSLVKDSGLTLLSADNNAIRFIPPSFNIPLFKSETAWLSNSDHQMVYLECKRKNDTLVFQAKMDGGTPEERVAVHGFAASHKPPFKVDKSVYDRYQVLYSKLILVESPDIKDEEIAGKLTAQWKSMVESAIADMTKACLDIPSETKPTV